MGIQNGKKKSMRVLIYKDRVTMDLFGEKKKGV